MIRKTDEHSDAVDGNDVTLAMVYDAEAVIAADFASTFLMPRHRGVLDCDDRFIIFGNDGYKSDERSRREAELVLAELGDHKRAFGVSREGYTWAIVLTDYTRELFNPDDLHELVSDAWHQAVEEIYEPQVDDSFNE